jgi:hypothetical protein
MTKRPLRAIAAEIRAAWPKPNYAALPYLNAMTYLEDIDGMYYADSARSIVLYFLSNATTWRGPEARRIKAELNALVKRED